MAAQREMALHRAGSLARWRGWRHERRQGVLEEWADQREGACKAMADARSGASASALQGWCARPTWRAARAQPPSERRPYGR
jgi:hypothetical protein